MILDPRPVADLARLFGREYEPQEGDPLPPLWHWVALARWAPMHLVGPDGHPRVGGFLPDVGLPRRMFAGGTVTLRRPLLVGTEVEREDRVVSTETKSGRRGKFVLVSVETRLRDAERRVALTEVQHLVYRESATPTLPGERLAPPTDAVGGQVLERDDEDGWRFQADPAALVRFSAATANAHRIHYDWPYATGVEGYPGLVVHGPLMTLAMAEVLRRQGIAPRSVTHRALQPLFCNQPAQIRGTSSEEDGTSTLTLVGPSGPCSELVAHAG